MFYFKLKVNTNVLLQIERKYKIFYFYLKGITYFVLLLIERKYKIFYLLLKGKYKMFYF